jgi:hypothetical protein
MPKWVSRDVHDKGAFIMKVATVGLDLAQRICCSFTQWIRKATLLPASS